MLLKGLGVEDSLSYLKQQGVYDHVSTLLMRLAAEKPKNALEVFEHVSSSIKAGGVKFPPPAAAKPYDEIKQKLEVRKGWASAGGFWSTRVE